MLRPFLAAIVASAAALALGGAAAEAAPAAVGYPPYVWDPAPATNYTAGRAGQRITHIVIHDTAGSYAGTITWFKTAASHVSAHYVVRASDGLITQMVREADTAWHVRGFNQRSIGIEHESRSGSYTEAVYRSSARLVCAIASRYGIPIDRTRIVGHSEVPDADHADPGPGWNWARYLGLVRSCAGTAALTGAAGPRATAGLERGMRGENVARLQRDLVALGLMTDGQVAGGPGIFGAITEAAVRRYQASVGLPATGYYGPLTASAMGRAFAAPAVAVPARDLSLEMRASDVATLQTLLMRLGYIDRSTGYFGPLTFDAVRHFQSSHGVPATGYYGPLTRAALTRALR
ncbi:MAG: peptidoglycan recognition protein family protein [Candidatus Limnocylindria bacterium]